jgi:hypothetical protein
VVELAESHTVAPHLKGPAPDFHHFTGTPTPGCRVGSLREGQKGILMTARRGGRLDSLATTRSYLRPITISGNASSDRRRLAGRVGEPGLPLATALRRSQQGQLVDQ